MEEITVNKMDAARRQLNTAILLLFKNQDIVSVHTLGHAANRILADLCEKSGGDSPLVKKMESKIKPEMMGEWRKHLNKFANFFKHADNDPYEISEAFNVGVNDFLIFMAYSRYLHLGNQETDEMLAFRTWFTIVYSPLFQSDELQEEAKKVFAAARQLLGDTKGRNKEIQMGHEILENIHLLKSSLSKNIDLRKTAHA